MSYPYINDQKLTIVSLFKQSIQKMTTNKFDLRKDKLTALIFLPEKMYLKNYAYKYID